ncbi:ROK family protein [Alteribacter keqinensis]|uniref:ROK family protein n=1 Tax=Alteribacter keqinensis TaxID=2483800 RepID=A0A3M7TSE8_9BACI|nr:ROK family protein [Alteribacter keqinensis]RNA67672.1 ROK family protein [Alteribacter keqinensis]
MKKAIGLDVGGTKILAAVVNEKGKITYQKKYPVEPFKGDRFPEYVVQVIEEVLDTSGEELSSIKGIGIATAGIIDSEEKKIVFAQNLGLEHCAIGEALKNHFNIPVKLYNDANAAAVAEYTWGHKKAEHLAYVTIGTGVGAGIISHGKLIRGFSDNAGEFGHISVNVHGERCGCGHRGCLELYTSGPAMEQSVAEKRGLSGRISMREINEMADDGDVVCREVLDHAGYHLGMGLVNLVHLFNSTSIVLGGGVMQSGEYLFERIRETVDTYLMNGLKGSVQLHRSRFSSEIGALGAGSGFFANSEEKSRISLV